jgi:hypothetical protein
MKIEEFSSKRFYLISLLFATFTACFGPFMYTPNIYGMSPSEIYNLPGGIVWIFFAYVICPIFMTAVVYLFLFFILVIINYFFFNRFLQEILSAQENDPALKNKIGLLTDNVSKYQLIIISIVNLIISIKTKSGGLFDLFFAPKS